MKHANRFSISYKNSPFKAGAGGWRKTRVRLSLPTKLEERTARDLAHATRHTEHRSLHALLLAARAADPPGLVNPACAEAEPRRGRRQTCSFWHCCAIAPERQHRSSTATQHMAQTCPGLGTFRFPNLLLHGVFLQNALWTTSDARGCADCHHLPSAQRGGRCRGAPRQSG